MTSLLLVCFLVATIYPLLIYPLILIPFGVLFGSQLLKNDGEFPDVTVLISVFNEEDVIANKLENTLSLNYPERRVQILVISDNSTDRTESIVNEYAAKYENIELIVSEVRRGKTAGLNDGVQNCKGTVIVFSDADALYDSDALIHIAHSFSDESIGLVTGSTSYTSGDAESLVDTSGFYTRLERYIKKYESMLGSCVGADGAIFALRKELYEPLNDDDINDLVIPLNVVRKGFRVIYNERVMCRENASSKIEDEFSRQVRITNRTLLALFRNRDLLNIFRYPVFSFEVFSHKILRFLIPLFMLLVLLLNIQLLSYGLVYVGLLFLQLTFYGFVIIGYTKSQRRGERGSSGGIFSLAYHFFVVQLAVSVAWYYFVSGKRHVVWKPRT